jgi:hypothetical protein
MSFDVIPSTKLYFVHAELPANGMIHIDNDVFHRGNKLEYFPGANTFDSLREAFSQMPEDWEDLFVMAFPENQTCEMFWFKEEQREKGITNRLNVWKSCYERYPNAIYKGE